MPRDSAQATGLKEAGGGGSSPGWQTDRGEREPPKLDYSCRATLNSVTHVRDDSARDRRHHMVADGETRSIPFRSDERTDGVALYKVRKFQFNQDSLFLVRLLTGDHHKALEISS